MEKLGIQRTSSWSIKTDFIWHEKTKADWRYHSEPLGGAHYDRDTTFKSVEKYILKGYNELKDLSTAELVSQRMDKYSKMGEFKE